MLSTLSHYYAKIRAVGYYQIGCVFWHRWEKKKKIEKLRARELNVRSEHTWQEIQKIHNYSDSFTHFLSDRKKQNLTFLHDWQQQVDESILNKANAAARNGFDLLGAGKQCFTNIPWHTDFRLSAQGKGADCAFNVTSFYADIKIPSCGSQEKGSKDIKVPWELSRFAHVIHLGMAFEKTGDLTYSNAFVEQVADWLDNNPYLFGINWVNPMEVALRATNWVLAFEYFKHEKTIAQSFWQLFICSLYDHFVYLESNWEFYDSRTNNHYLSNLVGYFALCCFFSDLKIDKKRTWCFNEILNEFDKQVFTEGLSYEGSTAYHKLVTELAYLFYLFANQMQITIPKKFEQKVHNMINALNWLTPEQGALITIGDDDSGSVLPFDVGRLSTVKNYGIKQFNSFGVSIIKTQRVHLTLRHHAYHPRQPSGHFHNDVGSITLAIDGIPVFVDPGSYVYTASAYWRNYFRSARQHNSFFLHDVEPVYLSDDLFVLNLPESKKQNGIKETDKEIILNSCHDFYSSRGLQAQRTVQFNKNDDAFVITDSWKRIRQIQTNALKTEWNITLGPSITAQKEGNKVLLFYKNDQLLFLKSDLDWQIKPCFVAQGYGKKVPSICLKALNEFTYTEAKTHCFIKKKQ